MKSKWEWFRLITPVLVTLGLVIVSDIRANVLKVENRLTHIEKEQNVSTQRIAKIEAILEFIKERRFKWQD